jgi:lysophospholipase L1-like esterase
MNRGPLKSIAVLVPVFILSFGWGYLAATDKLFPFGQIEAVKGYFVAPPNEAPQPSAYWLEKSSFFNTFGTHASVVMIGDSITDGAEWGEMFPGIAIANRGIDGDTTEGVLRRMEGIKSVHAKKAFVMIGINDFGNEGRTVEAVFGDYVRIVSQLEKSGMKVFVQSTLVCNEAKADWISCAAIQGKIKQLNGRLATLASGNVAYIDINAGLAGQSGLKAELTYDGVHLNGDGYRVWKREISKFILAD